jgi:mannose PTS system EIIA component
MLQKRRRGEAVNLQPSELKFDLKSLLNNGVPDMNDKDENSTQVRAPIKRIGGVVVTHGQLANELLAAAEMIIGPISYITSVSIGWHDDVEVAREEIERAISRVSNGRGTIILTDMFGGTPTNIASMFLADGEVEVVTGVNLPMLIKLATQTENESLMELAQRIRDQGKESIYLAGELLAGNKKSQAPTKLKL